MQRGCLSDPAGSKHNWLTQWSLRTPQGLKTILLNMSSHGQALEIAGRSLEFTVQPHKPLGNCLAYSIPLWIYLGPFFSSLRDQFIKRTSCLAVLFLPVFWEQRKYPRSSMPCTCWKARGGHVRPSVRGCSGRKLDTGRMSMAQAFPRIVL